MHRTWLSAGPSTGPSPRRVLGALLPPLLLFWLAAAPTAAQGGVRQRRTAAERESTAPRELPSTTPLELRSTAPLELPSSRSPLSPQAQPQRLEISLVDAVERALRDNLGLQTNRLAPAISGEGITGARGGFDPQVTLNLVNPLQRFTTQPATQLDGAPIVTRENFGLGGQFSENLEWGTSWQISWSTARSVTNATFTTFNPSFSSTLAMSVTQPLLRGFGKSVNRQPILVAENSFESSRETFRQQVQQTLLDTYRAYWNMVLARRTLEVREQALRRAQQELERNRIQVELGTRRPLELLQTQTQVASAEVNLRNARTQLQDRQDDLKRLINIEAAPGAGWDVDLVGSDEPQERIEPPDLEAAMDEALANDPGLASERINLRTRSLERRVAGNRLLPQLDLRAGLTLTGQGGDQFIRGGLGGEVTEIQEGGLGDSLRRLFSGDFNNWTVNLTLAFPLHNWQARAGHAQSRLQEEQARLRIADLEQQIRTRVRQSVRQLESQSEQLEAARQQRQFAELQLRAAELQLEMGTGDVFQTLQFQNTLTSAELAELQALVTLNIAWAQLEADKGTLIESLGVALGDAGTGTGSMRR